MKIYSENVLLAYFSERSKRYKPSTLWSHFLMLKANFIVEHNTDIGKFSKLIALWKQYVNAYKKMETFITATSNNEYLMVKVVLIKGIAEACIREEIATLTVDDIQNVQSALTVKIQKFKTKIQHLFTKVDYPGNI